MKQVDPKFKDIKHWLKKTRTSRWGNKYFTLGTFKDHHHVLIAHINRLEKELEKNKKWYDTI